MSPPQQGYVFQQEPNLPMPMQPTLQPAASPPAGYQVMYQTTPQIQPSFVIENPPPQPPGYGFQQTMAIPTTPTSQGQGQYFYVLNTNPKLTPLPHIKHYSNIVCKAMKCVKIKENWLHLKHPHRHPKKKH